MDESQNILIQVILSITTRNTNLNFTYRLPYESYKSSFPPKRFKKWNHNTFWKPTVTAARDGEHRRHQCRSSCSVVRHHRCHATHFNGTSSKQNHSFASNLTINYLSMNIRRILPENAMGKRPIAGNAERRTSSFSFRRDSRSRIPDGGGAKNRPGGEASGSSGHHCYEIWRKKTENSPWLRGV